MVTPLTGKVKCVPSWRNRFGGDRDLKGGTGVGCVCASIFPDLSRNPSHSLLCPFPGRTGLASPLIAHGTPSEEGG